MAWERIARGVWIGQPHLRRGDTRWYVIVKRQDYTEGRQRFLRGGPDRATAHAVATQLTRRLGAAGSSRVTVDQLLTAYEEAHIRTLRRETEKLQRAYIANHLAPHYHGKTAAELTKADLFDFGVHMLEGLEPAAAVRRFATVKNCLSLLRAALRWYWQNNEASMREWPCPATHVAEQIRRIRARFNVPRRHRRPAYTGDQLRLLMALAAEQDLLVHDLLALAAGTGMRLSEILGIRWENVDELRARIVPDEHGALWRIGKDGRPALYKSEREDAIGMPPGLLPIFQRRRNLRTSDVWVFADAEGKPFQQRNISARILRVRLEAVAKGVPIDRTFHSTRHTFASVALKAGQDLAWVQNQLGHHSAAFTAETYVHGVAGDRDLSQLDFSHRSQTDDTAHSEAPEAPDAKRLN